MAASEQKSLSDENRQLRQENEALHAELAVVRGQLDALRQELQQTLERMEKQERASMRQAAPFRRDAAKLIAVQEKKRPGRKAGHPGSFRQPPAVIDEVIDVPLKACPRCGGDVAGVEAIQQIIEEIPIIRPRVFQVITRRGKCACCGEIFSTHPLVTSQAQGCCRSQLGPRARMIGAWLNKSLGLPMRKTTAVLRKLLGLTLSAGGLSQTLDRLAGQVQGEHAALLAQLPQSPVVYADETSWYVGGDGGGTLASNWLWTFTTPDMTLYHVDRRSSETIRKMLGTTYSGVLVSDSLASYNPINCRKSKCIAHHLRAIRDAREEPGQKNPSYLDAWKTLFRTTLMLWHNRDVIPADRFQTGRQALEADLERLLDQSVSEPGDVRIQKRLLRHREDVLRCLASPEVEPTNNRAERALRPAVIARKLSCGNRSRRGQATWETLASLAATAGQRGKDFIEWLQPCQQWRTYLPISAPQ